VTRHGRGHAPESGGGPTAISHSKKKMMMNRLPALSMSVVVCAALSVSVVVCAASAGAQQAVPPGERTQGRLFPPIDLGLLESPDRDAWQKPRQIMDALGIADGSVVADLGAGGGWFTVRLARRVGPNGVVYAQDIQPVMLGAIERRVQREGLANVRTVLGTPSDPMLTPGRIDAALIVDTYNEMEDPVTLLRNVAEALAPQGRIGIVEFNKEGWGPGPPIEDRVDPETVIRDAETAGLRLLSRETFLQYQFFLVFGR
jgi:SAM-dependent methyltransferase